MKFLGAIAGAIAGAVGSVLGVVGSIASTIAGALQVGSVVFSVVANAIVALSHSLGVTKEEKAEDLGDRVIQAEEQGITKDDFDTYKEYLDALDDFEVDEEKSKEIPVEHKILRGMDASAQALQEKFPDNDIEGLLTAATKVNNQAYFTSERFTELAKAIENNPDLIDSLSKILNGKEMSQAEYYDTLDQMTAVERKLHPEMEESEINKMLKDLG